MSVNKVNVSVCSSPLHGINKDPGFRIVAQGSAAALTHHT